MDKLTPKQQRVSDKILKKGELVTVTFAVVGKAGVTSSTAPVVVPVMIYEKSIALESGGTKRVSGALFPASRNLVGGTFTLADGTTYKVASSAATYERKLMMVQEAVLA